MKTIGENIRDARKKSRLTQEELAKKTNLSRSHIGAIETNRYNPSLSTLQLIADAVGVEVSLLLGGQPVPSVEIPKGQTIASVILEGKDKITSNAQRTFNPPADFYDDPEVGKMATELRENPELNALLYASKDLTKEELKNVIELVKSIRKAHGMD